MAKRAGLTVKEVEKYIREGRPGRFGDGKGLSLRVREGGSWTWVLRVQVDGKRQDLGLGSDLTLEQARDKASELRRAAKRGLSAIEERDRDKKRMRIPTFKDAAIACHAAQKGGWTDRHGKAWLSVLEQHAYPTLGKKRVDVIEAPEIRDALFPIWTTKPVMARKVRQRICTVLNYAKGEGWRPHEAPVKSLSLLLARQAKGGNFAAMPYADVPAFVSDLRAEEETMGRLALLYTIATVARGGETRMAKVKHVDRDAKLWNRPAPLMKGRIAHSVTLNDLALEVLDLAAELRGNSRPESLLFPGKGGRPLSDMTITKVLRDAGMACTVHGFRSSFRDWAAEKMPTIPDPVAEAALAHQVPDAVIAAYKRTAFTEMRRQLLDAWGAYLQGRSTVVRLAVA